MLIVAISLPLQSQAQLPAEYASGKFSVRFNKNVELLGFGYFLVFETEDIESKTITLGDEEVLKKDWHSYGYHFYRQYQGHAQSESLQRGIALANHLWLDYLISLLLQVDDFPNATLPPDIAERAYINFSLTGNATEARENASLFLRAMNEFYREVQFDTYFSNSKGYYVAALEEIKSNLPEASFVQHLEDFYGSSFENYVLVPSLTIPKGMGFGIRHQEQVYNVFGAFDRQAFLNVEKPDMGFANRTRLRELSVHEFGHSFVGPALQSTPDEAFSATEHLFEPIRQAVDSQGYMDWQTALNEHFVRAGEIQIAQETAPPADVERLKKEYLETRQFIYIPHILKELDAYRTSGSYPYSDAVRRGMDALKALAATGGTTEPGLFPTNPADAQFHTADITRFWEVFDNSYPKLRGHDFQAHYVDKGSPGLRGFIPYRIESANKLVKTVQQNLDYYLQIRESSLAIDAQKEQFRQGFYRLKELYPEAVFPDVYFVIGRRNSGGTIFEGGLVIGAERFGTPNADFKPDIDIARLPNIIAHELVHFQQSYPEGNSLLGQCIREGAADFVSGLVYPMEGRSTNYEYGEANEAALWEEFVQRKNGKDWSGWLYSSKVSSRPADIGYWIGYKICEAYYSRMEDKNQAIRDILNIRDFDEFLQKSGYEGK